MTDLNDKKLRNRWADIKKQIKERPLLAYRAGIPLEDWNAYMHSTPIATEVARVYDVIQEDRKEKTSRIKEELSKIVGYRESKYFSRKSGISDTSIREIIEGKKEVAGYDLINKLELFLHRINPDFEPSIENPLSIKAFTQEYLGEIATDLDQIADSIKHYCFKLTEIARKMEKEKDWMGNEKEPASDLAYNLERLAKLKDRIDSFWKAYVDGRLN